MLRYALSKLLGTYSGADLGIAVDSEGRLLVSVTDPSGTFLTSALFTAKGSLIAGTGAATVGTLAVGTNGQILQAKSTEATGLVWTTATYPAIIGIGELLYGSAANVISGLAAGALTEILVGGGAAAPVWTTATGSGAPVRATDPTLVNPILGAASATNLGIGVDPALYPLHIVDAMTSLTDDNGLFLDLDISGTADANVAHRGLHIDIDSDFVGTQLTGFRQTIRGVRVDLNVGASGEAYLAEGFSTTVTVGSTGDIAAIAGNRTIAGYAGAGTVGQTRGFAGQAYHASGTTTLLIGVDGLATTSGAATGTVTEGIGVRSMVDNLSGTFTTGTLFQGAFTGIIGTKYGIVLTGDTLNSFDGDLNVKGGDLTIGVDDTVYGKVSAYGHATGSDEGGELLLYLAADHDTTISYFRIQAEQDDLLIGPDTDADALKLDALKDLYVTAGSVLIAATEYLNFGTTQGSTGYGIRDNSNVIEFKDSGGAWKRPRHFDSTPDDDHTYDGITHPGVVGEDFALFQVGYRKSDGKFWLAGKDAAATMPGVVLATAAIDESEDANGTFLFVGFARDDTWDWTVGGLIYVGDSGALTQTAPSGNLDIVQCVGFAMTGDVIFFNPNTAAVEVTA